MTIYNCFTAAFLFTAQLGAAVLGAIVAGFLAVVIVGTFLAVFDLIGKKLGYKK